MTYGEGYFQFLVLKVMFGFWLGRLISTSLLFLIGFWSPGVPRLSSWLYIDADRDIESDSVSIVVAYGTKRTSAAISHNTAGLLTLTALVAFKCSIFVSCFQTRRSAAFKQG